MASVGRGGSRGSVDRGGEQGKCRLQRERGEVGGACGEKGVARRGQAWMGVEVCGVRGVRGVVCGADGGLCVVWVHMGLGGRGGGSGGRSCVQGPGGRRHNQSAFCRRKLLRKRDVLARVGARSSEMQL